MKKDFVVTSLDEMSKVAQQISKTLPSSCVILLIGDLACGKTTWSRYFIEARGGAHVTSPTFALRQQYPLNRQSEIDHWDLYRIKNDEDLESTGFWENLYVANGVALIEWPEIILRHEWETSRPVFSLYITVDGEQRIIKLRSGKPVAE